MLHSEGLWLSNQNCQIMYCRRRMRITFFKKAQNRLWMKQPQLLFRPCSLASSFLNYARPWRRLGCPGRSSCLPFLKLQKGGFSGISKSLPALQRFGLFNPAWLPGPLCVWAKWKKRTIQKLDFCLVLYPLLINLIMIYFSVNALYHCCCYTNAPFGKTLLQG